VTWWIRAQTDAGMRADLVALGIRLDWIGVDNTDEAYLCGRANYLAAQSLLELALEIRERELGPQHRDTAWSLSNLALLHRDHGDLPKARPLFERALAIWKALDPEHLGYGDGPQ
jgi:tetratricopeptide (TPR) repeat protein